MRNLEDHIGGAPFGSPSSCRRRRSKENPFSERTVWKESETKSSQQKPRLSLVSHCRPRERREATPTRRTLEHRLLPWAGAHDPDCGTALRRWGLGAIMINFLTFDRLSRALASELVEMLHDGPMLWAPHCIDITDGHTIL